MANEITLTCNLSYSKGGTTVSMGVTDLKIDVSGQRFTHIRQNITTTEVVLDLGDIVTGGYCIMINRDAINFVSLRAASGAGNAIRINAGEAACFRFGGGAPAPTAIANTAAVEVEYIMVAN